MLLKLFVALLAFNLINAASIHKKDTSKTSWGLLEALSGTSGIRGFNGTWMSDEEIYFRNRESGISRYNAKTNVTSLFLNSNFLNTYGKDSTFTLSPDNTKILVRFDVEYVFRHSSVAKYDVFDIETQQAIHINNGEKLQFCTWSPIKDRLSFVHENNVYIRFQTGLEIKITSEGEPGVIYNGVPDWVYEEEVLSSGSAMWWSPDGTKLAVGYFDDSNVTSFKYQLYGDDDGSDYLYPKEVDLKYPKTGSPNPLVALKVFDLEADQKPYVKLNAPIDIVSADHILQNVAWSKDNQLLVTWLNRRQNIGTIQSCSYKGECREVKRLQEPKGWIGMGNPVCLSSGESCIFTNWIDNWYQIWNLNLTTGENIWKSRGNFTVLRIYGYDEVNDKIYYQATVPGDPSYYQVFSNDKCLSCDLIDADGDKCISASATFSKKFSYYTITCSGPNPSYTLLFEAKTHKQILQWEMNSEYRATLAHKLRPDIEFHNVSLADNSWGYVKLLLPPNLNKNKKYPMIVYVYGGPNSVRATSNFNVGFDAFLTTNRSVIVAIIDGRGTGNKGKDLLFSVNNNLGEYEVEDQIHVTKYLQKTLPYVDKFRTGIWGWSYGGYMTAKTIANDDYRVFQCGISVAPVTSWLYYDTIYTERYMGLPSDDDNKYVKSSVLEKVDNFHTHDFLLVHGSGDDNVHYQHSLLLAKQLQAHDILFEQMTYPDENHSIGRLSAHLYNTMDHFWQNCLGFDEDEF